MHASQITEQQRLAIQSTGRDLLVAASAGTGKTTVLAQRCVYLRVHKHVSLQQVLAVTFTDAAAADMRRKIGNELRTLVDRNPDDANLRRELLLIDRAPISTLHAFCLKLVREHFHTLDLDPGLSVVDPSEAELLKADVLDRLLEDWFKREDEVGARFMNLAEGCGGSGGQNLGIQIRRLHEFLQTLPDRDDWRNAVRAAYRVDDDFLKLKWFDTYRSTWIRELTQCQLLARDALTLIGEVGGLEAYRAFTVPICNTLDRWREQLDSMQSSAEWTEFLSAVRSVDWGRLPSPRGANPDDRERTKTAIDALRKRICDALTTRLAAQSPAQYVDGIRNVAPSIEVLFDLQNDFEREYTKTKLQRWMLDFNDLERRSYELLTRFPDAARSVRRRYRHILVDEYQDINPLQDAILQRLAGGIVGDKVSEMFCVGDEKQSIYGFRLAAPKLFLEKYRRFSSDPSAPEVRLPLTGNFRCRTEIIDAVNHIFGKISNASLGNSYGAEARLTYGAAFPSSPQIPEPIPVEMLLIDKPKTPAADLQDVDDEADSTPDTTSAELTDLEREALVVAARIRQLIGSSVSVWDLKRENCAKIKHRDIVILLRTMHGRCDVYADMLRKQGIPVYADLTTGFFFATEIRDMLSLLEVLDNARQDVPLAAVLRSPLVRLNEDDLADIRVHYMAGPFHEAVWRYADDGPNVTLRKRLADFRIDLNRWREHANQLPLARVIWDIYRRTHYLEYVQGLSGGAGRRANLVQLHERARQFDQFSRRGLFRFLKFLRQLQDADHDLGTAPVLSESDDVVRIMSIHKSKGLEFPVVFVPDLAKPFNLRDTFDQVLLHREMLIGVDCVDLDRMERAPTLPKLVIADEKRLDLLAEEQRLLYVALTRARERLILSGTTTLAKTRREWCAGDDASDAIRVLDAGCMLDWLGPIIANHPDTAPRLGSSAIPACNDGSRFSLTIFPAESISTPSGKPEATALPVIDLEAVSFNATVHADAEIAAAKSRLLWRYPHPHLRDLAGKVNVTELKRRFQPRSDEEQPGRDAVRRRISRKSIVSNDLSGRVRAAERGLATHAVLQRLDFAGELDPAGIALQIASMVTRGFLTADDAGAVDVAALAAFFVRPLGVRLRNASALQRELPFSLLLPARELPDAADRAFTPEECTETVLVQGVIDCLFWENGMPVLIDYKTDDVSENDLRLASDRYRVQMHLYRRALRAIYGYEVAYSYLVFLVPGIELSM